MAEAWLDKLRALLLGISFSLLSIYEFFLYLNYSYIKFRVLTRPESIGTVIEGLLLLEIDSFYLEILPFPNGVKF